MPQQSIAVTRMSCTGCEQNVEEAVGGIDGVTGVTANHESGTVEVTTEGVDDAEIHAAIEAAGYQMAA
jgi:copper chaperone